MTCPSYPASENADNTDTPSPPATSDRIVASSEASTWMRFAFGGSSFSAYCSAKQKPRLKKELKIIRKKALLRVQVP